MKGSPKIVECYSALSYAWVGWTWIWKSWLTTVATNWTISIVLHHRFKCTKPILFGSQLRASFNWFEKPCQMFLQPFAYLLWVLPLQRIVTITLPCDHHANEICVTVARWHVRINRRRRRECCSPLTSWPTSLASSLVPLKGECVVSMQQMCHGRLGWGLCTQIGHGSALEFDENSLPGTFWTSCDIS